MAINQKSTQEAAKARVIRSAIITAIILLAFIVLLVRLLPANLLNEFPYNYIVLIALGLVSALILSWVMTKNSANVVFKTDRINIALAGPPALAALVIGGGYYLVLRNAPIPLPQGIFGYVTQGHDSGELPVKQASIHIYGGPDAKTSDSGEFSIGNIVVRNRPQTAGDPVTFSVDGWVIWDPYLAERGRMFLPKPSADPIKLRVLRPHDRALLNGDSIEKMLGQRTFIFTTPSPKTAPATEWQPFLEDRARETGFSRRELEIALENWTVTATNTNYRKGLAALYRNRFDQAAVFFKKGLSENKGDLHNTVAEAYTQYRMGSYAESARLLETLGTNDPLLRDDLKTDQQEQQRPPQRPATDRTLPTESVRPTPIDAQSRYKAEQEERARNVVRSMVTGNFKAVTDDYTDGLTRFVEARRNLSTPAALGSTWQSEIDAFGPFGEIEEAQAETSRNPVVVLVLCRFHSGKVNIEVVFEPEPSHKICNLYVQPAPQRMWPPDRASRCL